MSKPAELGRTHYLLHHEIIRTDKHTNKLRVVYDASARPERSHSSLDDCWYLGPPMTPLVLDVLLRFRAYPVALTADIEKAFLNISVDPEHRDCLRFPWIDDIAAEEPRAVVFEFTRVVFGVSPSLFLLNGTIHYHLSNSAVDEELARKILDSLYVDDFVGGGDNDISTYKLHKNVKSCFMAEGFNMRKWVSSSTNVQTWIEKAEGDVVQTTADATGKIQEEDQTYSSSRFSSESAQESNVNHKVLGIGWNVEDDVFVFLFDSLRDAAKIEPVTKRVVLSFSAKKYDPLGLLSSIVLLQNIIFQCLCESKADWMTNFG